MSASYPAAALLNSLAAAVVPELRWLLSIGSSGLQVDPGTSATYQPNPNGTTGTSKLGYCNASLAVYPGLPPSNDPYCSFSQPAWSAYRCALLELTASVTVLGAAAAGRMLTQSMSVNLRHCATTRRSRAMHSVHRRCFRQPRPCALKLR